MPTRTRALALAAVLLLPTAAACSETIEEAKTSVSSLKDRASEEIDKAKEELQSETEQLRIDAIESAVAAAAPAAFSKEGYEIDGELTCTAESPTLGTFSVTCTGTTVDGEPAEVSGERPEGGDGSITGSVAGTQVFDSKDCFGLC